MIVTVAEADMKNIVIVGAGKIGSMIAELLVGSGDYAVTVIDRSQQQLDRLERHPQEPLSRTGCAGGSGRRPG